MQNQVLIYLFGFIFLSAVSFKAISQENYEVRNIKFRGNKTLDKDFLLERMALNEVSWLEKVVLKEEPFLYNEDLIELDQERLVRIYQSEGFLHVRPVIQIVQVNDKRNKLNLLIEIEEGDPVTIDTQLVVFPKDPGEVNLDSIYRRMNRKPLLTIGERFRDEALQEDLLLLEDAYRTLGYAYVKTDYQLNLEPSDLTTGIRYTVNPGPLSRFGETTITGNDHVSEKFIRKQLRYDKDSIYNEYQLTRTRQALYQLQLFSVVSVLPQKETDTEKSPIPVRIYVEEAPRISTRLGAGYGTEEKFRTFVDFTYRGFLGGARRINLLLKHSALEPYSARLRWIQPQFLGMKTSIAVEPFIMRNTEPGYDTRTYGVRVPLDYIFNRWLNLNLSYYFEDSEQTIEEGDEEFTDFESDKFPYKKSGLLLVTRLDNSTPEFSPDRGLNVSTGFRYNGYFMGGDFSYTQLWGDLRTYQKLGDLVMAFRIMAGGIHSSDSSQFIPVENRFYSGGSFSVRGWARSQLGPRRESGTPLGGKSIFESNIEARYPLFWRISLVAFFEGGNVWEKSYHYELNNLSYAVGTGLRVETPIGPIRFDVGFPVWEEKRSPEFFISVGQAF
jgi:outer membrane protein insertion porin family